MAYTAFRMGVSSGAIQPHRTFTFLDEKYDYLWHPYRRTWRNERAVELPIVQRVVEKYRQQRILEVGNVLAHYMPVGHPVIDKFERSPGVINEDVAEFTSTQKFDLIVSVSTLEHVGWDENHSIPWKRNESNTPHTPAKFFTALERLKACLARAGKIVATIPVGYNTALDDYIARGVVRLDDARWLMREGRYLWTEASAHEARKCRYGSPYPRANALLVATWKN